MSVDWTSFIIGAGIGTGLGLGISFIAAEWTLRTVKRWRG